MGLNVSQYIELMKGSAGGLQECRISLVGGAAVLDRICPLGLHRMRCGVLPCLAFTAIHAEDVQFPESEKPRDSHCPQSGAATTGDHPLTTRQHGYFFIWLEHMP